MKITLIILTTLVVQFSIAAKKHTNDVYVIFYATDNGKTGHMGIAVDNYRIVYRDIKQAGDVTAPDTFATGELTYYDLWPRDDNFSANKTGKDIPGMYYKLPVSSFEAITVNSLCDKGLPHKENYPCDGLLMIHTTPKQDEWITSLLDSMVKSNRPFNGRYFNCADFVKAPLERLLNRKLESREFIPPGWSTTPNKLYRNLRKIGNIKIMKNADKKATGSFIGQRIIFCLFHRKRR